MKRQFTCLLATVCFQPLFGQIVIEETVVEKTVTETVGPVNPPPVHDPAFVRRHLSVVPRDVVVPAHPPGTVVETTATTRSEQRPGQPDRVYSVERSVVIVEGRELPYVTVPVLFEKETARLLDVESRVALAGTAAAILEVLKTQPAAVFDIEGHTSTDGTDEFNLKLSAERALRTHQELTRRYLVPASALSAHGYGEMYPAYPRGTEEQMMLDRRVLVVRKQ
jgi:outer membrane protein OmpA-like peptidoglycan-associated protein